MKPRRKRMWLVAFLLVGVGAAVGLAVTAFQENMLYFYDVSEVVGGKAPTGHSVRVGGMVVDGSVERTAGTLQVRFTLSDYAENLPVSYTGILPDLFREGQGIIATGTVGPDGTFTATEVLAKHDEEYMPPGLEQTLKKNLEDGKAGGT